MTEPEDQKFVTDTSVILQKANDDAALWRIFLKSGGWKHYEEFVLTQIAGRRDLKELDIPEGMDSMIKGSHINAELAGLRLAVEYPQKALEALEDQIEGLKATLTKLDTDEEE